MEQVLGRAYAFDWPARAWARVPGATEVEVVRHHLPILPAGMPPLRVGFMSDLHIGPTTPEATQDAAVAALAALDLDVLALGGDYVWLAATPAKARRLAQLVDAVPARLKVAVWGNHDLWTLHVRLERALREVGVQILVNEAVRLPEPWDRVALLGLDEPYTADPDADAAVAACGDAVLRLGLSHAPEGIEGLAGRVAMVMCGHTHGGQVATPRGPIWVPGPLGERYHAGRFEVDGTTLLVSRGVGGVEIPVRLFAPPDVLLVELSSPGT